MQAHAASVAVSAPPVSAPSSQTDMIGRYIESIQKREPCIKERVRRQFGLNEKKLNTVLMHARGGDPEMAREILKEAWDDLQNLVQVH